MYNNERLELLENSTLFKFWQNGKLKHYSWNGDDLPQQFGHPHCFRHNKQHVLRPSKGWMVVGGTHVLPPGTRHPGTPSSLEIQTTMFIRCPAQCEAGSSVGKWAGNHHHILRSSVLRAVLWTVVHILQFRWSVAT